MEDVVRRKSILIISLLIFCFFLSVSNAQEEKKKIAVYVIVNIKNKVKEVKELSVPQIKDFFLKKKNTWSDGKTVIPYQYPYDNELRRAFQKYILKMTAEEEKKYWVDARVKSGTKPPSQKSSPRLIARFIGRVKGGIGYITKDSFNKKKNKIVYKFEYDPKEFEDDE